MSTYIKTLRDPNGDQIAPRTTAAAVTTESGDSVEEALAKPRSYHKVFTAANWTEATEGSPYLYYLEITASEHGLGSDAALARVRCLSNGRYISNAWACMETYAETGLDGTVSLYAYSAFNGDAVLTA